MTSSPKLIIAGAVVVVAATATVIATQGSASRDATRLSNTGRQQVEIRRVVIRSVPIRHGSLLAVLRQVLQRVLEAILEEIAHRHARATRTRVCGLVLA